jgi:hypothetical protein
MAPEVLLGNFEMKTYGDRADVYSFGILVNEFLDESPPYMKILNDKNKINDLITRVTTGAESGKNRPKLTSGIKILKEMIQKCWQLEPQNRPSFQKLKEDKPWDQARTASSNIHKNMVEILDLFSKDVKTVKFPEVLKKFAEVLGESNKLSIKDENGPFDGHYIRTLMAALGIGKGTDPVTLESVRRVINWLSSNVQKKEVLDILYKVFTENYFFGLMEEEQAKEVLSKSGKEGSYLIRWSNQSGQFILDYIPKKQKKKRKRKTTRVPGDFLSIE